jgi:hypothetical protein
MIGCRSCCWHQTAAGRTTSQTCPHDMCQSSLKTRCGSGCDRLQMPVRLNHWFIAQQLDQGRPLRLQTSIQDDFRQWIIIQHQHALEAKDLAEGDAPSLRGCCLCAGDAQAAVQRCQQHGVQQPPTDKVPSRLTQPKGMHADVRHSSAMDILDGLVHQKSMSAAESYRNSTDRQRVQMTTMGTATMSTELAIYMWRMRWNISANSVI